MLKLANKVVSGYKGPKIPENGGVGQILTMTEDGCEWQDNTDLSDYYTKEDIEDNYAKKNEDCPDLVVGTAKNLISKESIIIDSAYKPIGDNVEYDTASIESIRGNSIAWNQLSRNINDLKLNFEYQKNSDGTVTVTPASEAYAVSSNTINYNHAILNHKYLLTFSFSGKSLLAWVGANNIICYGNEQLIKKSLIITTNLEISSNSAINNRPVFGFSSSKQNPFTLGNVQCFDLTLIYGIGKEPTTPEQFEEDYFKWFGRKLENEEFDEGSIRHCLDFSIKTIGTNLYSGEDLSFTSAQNVDFHEIWSNDLKYKGQIYIQANISIENTNGLFRFRVYYTDGSNEITSGSTATNYIAKYLSTKGKIVDKIYTWGSVNSNGKYSNIQVNLVYDNTIKEYERYSEYVSKIPITELTSNGIKIFPNGLNKAGSVYDEIKIENGITKAIKRIETLNLGNQMWYHINPDESKYPFGWFYAEVSKAPIRNGYFEVLSYRYVTDKLRLMDKKIVGYCDETNYGGFSRIGIIDDYYNTHPDDFQSSLQGVILYYELAEPEEYIIDNFELPVAYKIDNYGTQQIIQSENSIAPSLVIKYGIDATDSLIRIFDKLNDEWYGTQDEYNKLGTYDKNVKYYILED